MNVSEPAPLDSLIHTGKNSLRACVRAWEMNFSQMKDERILAFYENVRRQVEIDKGAGSKYRFASGDVKEYAEQLRNEIDRRQLRYSRIDWS